MVLAPVFLTVPEVVCLFLKDTLAIWTSTMVLNSCKQLYNSHEIEVVIFPANISLDLGTRDLLSVFICRGANFPEFHIKGAMNTF